MPHNVLTHNCKTSVNLFSPIVVNNSTCTKLETCFITPENWQEKYVISVAFVLNKFRKNHKLHFNFSQANNVHLSVDCLFVNLPLNYKIQT